MEVDSHGDQMVRDVLCKAPFHANERLAIREWTLHEKWQSRGQFSFEMSSLDWFGLICWWESCYRASIACGLDKKELREQHCVTLGSCSVMGLRRIGWEKEVTLCGQLTHTSVPAANLEWVINHHACNWFMDLQLTAAVQGNAWKKPSGRYNLTELKRKSCTHTI